MRSYLNLFLTLVMPISILFTAVATVYFAMQFEFTKVLPSKTKPVNTSILLDPTIYEKKHQSTQANIAMEALPESDSIEEKFILLIDKELAYEISLNTIETQGMGEIMHQNKKEGIIIFHNKDEEIKINISSLTKHTAQVLITSSSENSQIKHIISMLKEKEHSFIQY